jgi:hypothetical protein
MSEIRSMTEFRNTYLPGPLCKCGHGWSVHLEDVLESCGVYGCECGMFRRAESAQETTLEDAIAKNMGVDWDKAEAMMRSKGWISLEEGERLREVVDAALAMVKARNVAVNTECDLGRSGLFLNALAELVFQVHLYERADYSRRNE